MITVTRPSPVTRLISSIVDVLYHINMTFFESLAKSCQKRSILHTTNVYDVTNIITLK
jgi:hypothetical protein